MVESSSQSDMSSMHQDEELLTPIELLLKKGLLLLDKVETFKNFTTKCTDLFEKILEEEKTVAEKLRNHD